jgi:hypothetical protein
MNNIIIQKSNKSDKKFTAIINNTKKIHFGSSFYEDYTQHKNEARKKSYLSRHKHDNYTNPNYAGFYATNLLWNKKTLKESIVDTNRKYKNLNIKLK